MITSPILPIWLMSAVCVALLLLKRKGITSYIRQIVIIVLIFVINLRIRIPDDHYQSEIQNLNANVLFVIDSTISMVARDYDGDTERLKAVYKDSDKIIDELYGAKFSVLSFHNKAQLLAPYTNDAEFIKSVIHSISPLDPLWARGSSMNICKDKMKLVLKNAKDKQDGITIVFFVSDGEITNSEKLESFRDMKDLIDDGAVLGYGTQTGGKMFTKDRYTDESLAIEDTTNYPFTDAISKIDESNLKQLASDMDIRYINMNNQDGIDEVIQRIKNDSVVSTEQKDMRGYVETYYIFAILLGVLLLYELVNLKRRL